MEAEFTKTPHCRREVHCGRCRDLEGGRAWRKGISKRFNVPEADWPCPKGHEWGYKPTAREPKATKPDSESVVARRAACEACDVEAVECGVKHRLMVLRKQCWFNGYIKRPGAVCPKERWPTAQALATAPAPLPPVVLRA